MLETGDKEEIRKIKTIPGIGLPAGTDYPNIEEMPAEPCKDVFWRKEVANAFEIANNGYSFYRIAGQNAIFAKDLSGYWYRLNNETKCFEFLFEGFKDTTDYTRISIPPQAPSFVGFNYLHQAVFPMNEDGQPILPKDDRGKTIFPFLEGYPLFPVDDSGAICVPLGDDGKPVFPRIREEYGAYVPCDVTGRVVLPLNEKAEPIYPRDEEGNVLMPFVICEDGSRKRAVYLADDGTPILPFNNGEHAIEVHEGEVLFQYEYQQKMMMLAQYPGQKRPQAALMDEQFYQQHAQHYQSQMDVGPMEHSPKPDEFGGKSGQNSKNTAQNLLLKQLTFLKKKQEPTASPVAEKPAIPTERPAKPNKEKERGERYIPEPSRRNRPDFRNDYRNDRNLQKQPSSSGSRRDDRNRQDRKSHRARSRSLTWSPERKRSRSRENEKRKRGGDEEKEEGRDRRKSRNDEKRMKRSRSESSNTDYEERGERRRKSEKFRR